MAFNPIVKLLGQGAFTLGEKRLSKYACGCGVGQDPFHPQTTSLFTKTPGLKWYTMLPMMAKGFCHYHNEPQSRLFFENIRLEHGCIYHEAPEIYHFALLV